MMIWMRQVSLTSLLLYRRLRPIADQFSAQRVGGAYLGITLEKIPFVVALTTYMEPIAICIFIKHLF